MQTQRNEYNGESQQIVRYVLLMASKRAAARRQVLPHPQEMYVNTLISSSKNRGNVAVYTISVRIPIDIRFSEG